MGVIWTRHAEERWQESLDTLLDELSGEVLAGAGT